jgi:hypothetical protein
MGWPRPVRGWPGRNIEPSWVSLGFLAAKAETLLARPASCGKAVVTFDRGLPTTGANFARTGPSIEPSLATKGRSVASVAAIKGRAMVALVDVGVEPE